MCFSATDLPAPEAPMMDTVSPSRTSMLNPFSTSLSPNVLWTS
jgi:hypothetical protein